MKSYSFGNFELTSDPAELRKNGRPMRMAPQPLQALVLLVERAGQIVTREEIQKVTWSDGTAVDFELGLNRCISRIRSSLLDSADSPRYLETIPRVGYRFIAPVKTHSSSSLISPDVAPSVEGVSPFDPSTTGRIGTTAESSSPVQAPVETLSAPPGLSTVAAPDASVPSVASRTRNLRWFAIAVGSAVLFTALGFLLRPVRHGIIDDQFSPVPLSADLGIATSPSFSPSGQQVAFAWNGQREDNFDIYVKMVDSPAVVRLTSSPEVDFSPAWSPDGRSIAFCRGSFDKNSAIWITSALGGPERKLVDLNQPAIVAGRIITWTPDGASLFYSDVTDANRNNDERAAIFVVNIASGTKKQLTFPPNFAADLYPASAPDGHALAFTRDTGRGVSSIYMLAVRSDGSPSGEPKLLSWPGFENVMNARPKWTPDSRDLVFRSNRTGEGQMWAVAARSGAKPKLLAALGNEVEDCAISANGTLAIARASREINIWKLPLKGGSDKRETSSPVRVLASTRIQTNPAISPDGTKIAYSSNRSGFSEIWTANVDGSESATLTSLKNPITGSPSWSHDGSRIAFDSRTSGQPGIYIVPTAGGSSRIVSDKVGRSVVPTWSADDSFLFFSSDRSGSSQIWKIPVSGGNATRLTHTGGFAAISSPEGAYLYYLADRRPTTSLRRLDLKTGEELTLAADILSRKYYPAKQGVYFMSGTPNQDEALYFWNLQTRRSALVAKFDKPIDGGFAISPDESYLYYAEVDQGDANLMLVNDFWR